MEDKEGLDENEPSEYHQGNEVLREGICHCDEYGGEKNLTVLFCEVWLASKGKVTRGDRLVFTKIKAFLIP